jgi:hypothetical protein
MRRRWKQAEQYTLRPERAAKGTTADSPQELHTTVVRVSRSSRKPGATARVPLSAWRALRVARHAEQRLGGFRWPTAANERRSSPEKVNESPQSRQVETVSGCTTVESIERVGNLASLTRRRGTGHRAEARPTGLVRGPDLLHRVSVGSGLVRTQLTWQSGRARITQAWPDNVLAALATASGRATRNAISHGESMAGRFSRPRLAQHSSRRTDKPDCRPHARHSINLIDIGDGTSGEQIAAGEAIVGVGVPSRSAEQGILSRPGHRDCATHPL